MDAILKGEDEQFDDGAFPHCGLTLLSRALRVCDVPIFLRGQDGSLQYSRLVMRKLWWA